MNPNALLDVLWTLYTVHAWDAHGTEEEDEARQRCQRWLDAILPPPTQEETTAE